MAETSYQMLEVLSFCDRERAFKPLSLKATVQTFLVKKNYNEAFRDVFFVLNRRKTWRPLKSNLVLVFESFEGVISAKKLKFNGNTQIS